MNIILFDSFINFKFIFMSLNAINLLYKCFLSKKITETRK